MDTSLQRRAVSALIVAIAAVPAMAQRPDRSVDRGVEAARRVLEAARSAGLVELPEPDEPSFLDAIEGLDLDAVAPLDDVDEAWRTFDGVMNLDRGRRSRRSRLNAIGSTAAPPVRQFVTYFTRGAGRSSFETGYRRSGLYRALAEREFREAGVPIELVWLAQVESLWKPWAVSSASAKGLWQFIPSTGARFGLDLTRWVDERADPLAATPAAARYLRVLHERFGDWLLALAAYNAGEGAVSKAVSRGGRRDFWYLYRRGLLPRETRNYVPAILATIDVARNPARYGVHATPLAPWRYDSVRVRTQTSLANVASLCGVSLADVWQHNTDLRRGVTPPGAYVVRIPFGTRARYVARASR